MNATLPRTVNILVVDDEAVCRDAVVDILRTHREFQVDSAPDGIRALEMLAKQDFDVVILDLGMPHMDGLSVLNRLRSDPRTLDLPVVLLTDNANRATVQSAAAFKPSGYLLKSTFTVESLIERVQAAAAQARSAMKATPKRSPLLSPRPTPTPTTPPTAPVANEAPKAKAAPPPPKAATAPDRKRIAEAIQRQTELSTVSPALTQVLKLTATPGCSIHEVVDNVRQDPTLSLRIMKVANSCLYSTGSHAKTLLDAAGRLGLTGIRNAVITVTAKDEFDCAFSGAIDKQRFWEHSLATAIIAQEIASRVAPDLAEDAYLAGLLHDVGRLVLVAALHEEYDLFLADAQERNVADLAALERETFGLTHADVSSNLLTRRGLPTNIVEAAARHEHPISFFTRATSDGTLPLITALANRVSHALALGNSGSPTLLPFQDFAAAAGLSSAVLVEIGLQAANQISDRELFFSCFSGTEFKIPLAQELAQRASKRPRIRVLAEDAPNDPLSLFLGHLQWTTDGEADTIAVFNMDPQTAQNQIQQHLAATSKQAKAPKVLLVNGSDTKGPGQQLDTGHAAAIPFPIGYAALIDALLGM